MSDLYQFPQLSYYLSSNGYPPNRPFYHNHFQYPPPYSQPLLPPQFLPKQPLPPHPYIFPPHPSSLRRRLSRPSSLRVQRHGRFNTLKKRRRVSTVQPPAFPVSGTLSSVQLARGRPHGWRPGYKPPSTESHFRKHFKRHFEGFIVPYKFTITHPCILTPFRLNPLLVAIQTDRPNIFYDLRKPQTEDAIFFPCMNRLSNAIDFCQLISFPPIHHMMIWHRKLPWQIHIEASQPNGITIYDFFLQIHQQLHQSIATEEYYTDELTPGDRELLTMAFHKRCALFPDQSPAGVQRIDFLGQEVCFIGLKGSRGGRWEFKSQLPPPKERMTID